MKKTILTIALLFLFSGIGWGQVSLNDASKITIDFTTTVNGVNEGAFAGTGFSPTPATGQLNSNAWAVTGLSDGVLNFGGTNTSGDYARGRSTGGVTTRGLYAFEVGTSNYALGFQAIGSDFTPGTITLKITNNTGKVVTDLAIAYNIWEYNDQERSNSLNFSHSADNSTYTDISGLNYTTTQAADASPAWASTNKSTTISGLNIADGVSYYIRWSSDDVGGSGSRDEIAIDDIEITPTLGAANPATKLAITSISPSVPSVGTPFDVTVQAQDSGGLPANVSSAVDITLTRDGGTGALGGTLTGTIADGTNEVTISGVTYNTAELGVTISAADDASNLTAGTSAAFEVLAAADQLVFEQVPGIGFKAQSLNRFRVVAQRSGDGSTDLNYTKDITLSKASGPGTIGGTLTKTAVAGVVTFDDITFDTDGDYTIQATDGSLTGAVSSTITISSPDFVEDFSNSNATGGYRDDSFVGNDGIIWNYIESRDENGDANNSGIAGKAIMLRKSSDNSKIISNSISGGIGDFSVKLYKGFTGSGDRQVELFVNGESQGASTAFDDYNMHAFTVNNINVSGDIVIEIKNITGNQIIVDDIAWSKYDIGTYNVTVDGTEGWRMLSTPVSDGKYSDLLGSIWTQGFSGANYTSGAANVQTFNVGTESFGPISNLTDAMPSGQGFITYVYSDDDYDGTPEGFPKTLSLSGTENSGNVATTLNSGAEGWSLVGNPYASIIEWDVLYSNSTDLKGTVYVYDHGYDPIEANSGDDVLANEEAGGGYRTWNGTAGSLKDGKIATFQGFWTQNAATITTGPVLTFTEAAKSVSGNTFYKQSTQSASFRMIAQMGGLVNDAYFSFTNEGEIGKDNYDGLKLSPLDHTDHLSLSTMVDGELMDINNLPFDLKEDVEFPLEVNFFRKIDGGYAAKGGEVTLRATDLKNIPDNWRIVFNNYNTGETLDLREQQSCTFQIANKAKMVKEKTAFSVLSPVSVTREKSLGSSGFSITIRPEGVSVETEPNEQPEQFSLEQNYPNPFNPSTRIQYSVAENGPVTLTIYNVMGQQVETLVNKAQSTGTYRVSWNAANMASGIYYYRLQAGNQILTRQMTLIK